MTRLVAILLTVLLTLAISPSIAIAQTTPIDADAVNDALGVGVNLGNALEAEREGLWGMTIQAEFFELIASAGFGHVRVPIKFSAYADESAPYMIPDIDDSVVNAVSLWQRIDWVIAQAEANNLYVIVDLHHYDELHDDPAGHRDRFLSIWAQIAERYAAASSRVLFELLNEPTGAFSDDPTLLNQLIADGVTTVRATNPTRPIIVGPARFNSIDALDQLLLPADPNLIVSVHFYEPFTFTHQGATWVEPNPVAPVDWDADGHTLGNGWQDWSWDTTLTPGVEQTTVRYDEQWAGLSFARPGNPLAATSLQLNATSVDTRELTVRCGPTDDTQAVDIAMVTIDAAANVDTIDLTACPATTDRISLQNRGAPGDMTIKSAEVCLADGTCFAIIESGTSTIEASFDKAQQWGNEHQRPLHVGEFGAYDAEGLADLNERAEWTSAVRKAIHERDMSASYWEFGAGFGVYDRDTDTWVQPLLDALIVDTQQANVGDEIQPAGDVNCDGSLDLADVRAMLEHMARSRTDSGGCPLDDPSAELHRYEADLNSDGLIDLFDILIAARCVFGACSIG